MALYKKEKLNDGGIIAIWRITETEEELKNIALVPTEEQENIDLIVSPQRRLEFYAVRALINEIFTDKVYLGYHEDNSPYIKNSHRRISISHAGEFVCIYTHENAKNVGVDIESLSRNFDAVEKKILSDDEYDFLVDEYRQIQLALIWSAKEAIYKLMAERNVNFLEKIKIEEFIPYDDEGVFHAIYTNAADVQVDLEVRYKIFEGFEMVWVSL